MPKKKKSEEIQSPNASRRPPVVVVLGHVDHGKTTLLDAIRQTDVVSKEHGGITQHIGAYQVHLPPTITFLDTPGHEAFSQMRSRGVGVADIAVLIVAADDGVMPQTKESIKLINEAKIPVIAAINKIDLPGANLDKVKRQLVESGILLEGYGGDVPYLEISAKLKKGIKEVLELVLLVAEINEIGKNDPLEFSGVIIESRIDVQKGALATLLVKSGAVRKGDEIYADDSFIRIRSLINDRGEIVDQATAGMPVEVIGFKKPPQIGSRVSFKKSESPKFFEKVVQEDINEKKLKLILKVDVLGSKEAILGILPAEVEVLSSATGNITESDILLAKYTGAIVLGFNVKVSTSALKLAEVEKVLVRTYKIIYELQNEVKDAIEGLLSPPPTEDVLGTASILAQFPYEKMTVAGCRIVDGRLARGDNIKIIRGEEEIGRSKIKSLRVAKDEINKIESGKECGVLLEPQIDFSLGDVLQSYRLK